MSVEAGSNVAEFTVQDVSRRTGLSDATLRYYERIGLIDEVDRDPSSGHRRYDRTTVDTLESLACLRSAGMRVEDMRRYLALLARGHEAASHQRELFEEQACRLADQIEALQLRLEYLRLKSAFWDARDRGDAQAERDLVLRLRAVVEQF